MREYQRDGGIDERRQKDETLDGVDEPTGPRAIGAKAGASYKDHDGGAGAHHERPSRRCESEAPEERLDRGRDEDRTLKEQQCPRDVEQVIGWASSCFHAPILDPHDERFVARS